jgi:hypothetical protein
MLEMIPGKPIGAFAGGERLSYIPPSFELFSPKASIALLPGTHWIPARRVETGSGRCNPF